MILKNKYFFKSILLILTIFSTISHAEVVKVHGSGRVGSGVVIGPNKVLTNCHLFDKEYTGVVMARNTSLYDRHASKYEFYGAHALPEKDLCLINVNTSRFKVSEISYNYQEKDLVNAKNIHDNVSGQIVDIVKREDNIELIGSNTPWIDGASGGGLYKHDKLIGITTYITHGETSIYWAVSLKDIEKIFSAPLVMKVKGVTLYNEYYKNNTPPNKVLTGKN